MAGRTYRGFEAIPYLENGAFFVLQPELNKAQTLVRKHKMRLRFACGEFVEGTWGNAKNELERANKLEPFYFGKDQAWKIKKALK